MVTPSILNSSYPDTQVRQKGIVDKFFVKTLWEVNLWTYDATEADTVDGANGASYGDCERWLPVG